MGTSSENASSSFILLLDGPKGAGKSTVSALLKDRLVGAVTLSLDHMRSLIPNSQPTNDYNQLAFRLLIEKVRECLRRHQDVIVDSGLSEERVRELREVAAQAGASLHSYALIAPFDVLLSRVRARDAQKGRVTDEERFRYTYAAQQAKDFSQCKVFDTSAMTPGSIVDAIFADIHPSRV